jgi:plasmid stabilization system protein ParE
MTGLAFHPDSLAEFEAAVPHYKQQQAGLGRRFIANAEAALNNIHDAPTRWPELAADVRRHLMRVFPYAVLYAIEPDRILVLAVMHCHREPSYWRNRVETRS